MTKNKLVAQFYFTLLLLNELQIAFGSSDQTDPVAELIAELQASGSTRKDSLRMWAARSLPVYGNQALRALPQLHKACSDPLPGVRAWAHHALARLEGQLEAHREAIRQIANEDTDSLTKSFIRSALDELDRTPDQHAIEALRSFCITNETKEIRRLLSMVSDVDALDHNGKRALEYAVGNSNVDAVTLLLEHGADPNLKTKQGETYLEVANALRDGKEIVGLLLLHGAEPARKSSWPQRFLEALRRFVS